MGNRIEVSRSLRWKWRIDDVRAHWRRVWRLYDSRMYTWGRR
jgi:hypothetical protein